MTTSEANEQSGSDDLRGALISNCRWQAILNEALGASVHQRLTQLNLKGRGIDDDDVCFLSSKYLALDPPLERVVLANNKITSVGAAALANALLKNTNLQRIGLNNNDIDHVGAEAIADILRETNTLKRMGLNGNRCGTRGAKAVADALRTNTSLEALGMSANGIGFDGAASFAEVLKTNATLKRLYLDNDDIGPEGAEVIAEALVENSTLQWLGLAENAMRERGLRALTNALESNRGLHGISLQRNGVENRDVIANLLVAAHSPHRAQVIEVRLNDVLWKAFPVHESEVSLLGRGRFGSAFKVVDSASGESLVYKVETGSNRHDDRVERNIVQMIPPHPHVLRMSHWCDDFSARTSQVADNDVSPQGASISDGSVGAGGELGSLHSPLSELDEVEALAVPLYPGGCLEDLLRNKEEISLSELMRIAYEMALGVSHLHENNIIHRDIALRNFVLSGNNEVVLIDLGLARIVSEEHPEYPLPTKEILPWRSCAPEVFIRRSASTASDVWMFGMALWELLGVFSGVPWAWLAFTEDTPVVAQLLLHISRASATGVIPLLWPRQFLNVDSSWNEGESASELPGGPHTMPSGAQAAQTPSESRSEPTPSESRATFMPGELRTPPGTSHITTEPMPSERETGRMPSGVQRLLLLRFRELIEACCVIEESKRPTMKDVVGRLHHLLTESSTLERDAVVRLNEARSYSDWSHAVLSESQENHMHSESRRTPVPSESRPAHTNIVPSEPQTSSMPSEPPTTSKPAGHRTTHMPCGHRVVHMPSGHRTAPMPSEHRRASRLAKGNVSDSNRDTQMPSGLSVDIRGKMTTNDNIRIYESSSSPSRSAYQSDDMSYYYMKSSERAGYDLYNEC